MGGDGWVVQIANFGEKNPQPHLIIIREWPKNSPQIRNLDNFVPGAFYLTSPFTIRHERVKAL